MFRRIYLILGAGKLPQPAASREYARGTKQAEEITSNADLFTKIEPYWGNLAIYEPSRFLIAFVFHRYSYLKMMFTGLPPRASVTITQLGGMGVTLASHLLICEEDHVYTVLNRFDSRSHQFEGEYSLLHNDYASDGYFLSSFLFDHAGHPLRVVHSDMPSYYEVRQSYTHYREEDVPRYIEALRERRKEAALELSDKRQLG